MGKTGSRRHGFGALAVLALVAMFVQACSDNKGPAGPTFGADQTGHADTATQIVVQVAVNPNTIELGRRAGITVLVTNTNGRPLQGRHVQLSTTAGRLDVVDGSTDAGGKFVSFLFADKSVTATSATITAFVEGAVGTGVINFTGNAPLVIVPATVTQQNQAVGTPPGVCAVVGGFTAQFTVSGGVPPYTFRISALNGGQINQGGAFSIPAFGPLAGGTAAGETITVIDAQGNTATATVTISCVASTPPPAPTP